MDENIVSLHQAADLIVRNFYADKNSINSTRTMLHSAPGAGKSSILRKVVQKLIENTGEAWVLYSLRLNQRDPTDLKGVPIYIEIDGVKYASWATPYKFPILNQPKSADGCNVLIFLDEVMQATPAMQHLFANVIDGVIGDELLDPKRTLIVGASNRKQDGSAVMPMPLNVKTRLMHYTIVPSLKEWIEYGTETNIHPLVLSYLHSNPNNFNEEPNPNVMTLANPRTWEMLSNDINYYGDNWIDNELSRKQCVAALGQVGSHFHAFCKTIKYSATIQKIISGSYVQVPTSTDMLFSLVYASVAWINNQWGTSNFNLTSEIIKGTNNLYAWFDQDKIDISTAYLLNKYQTDSTKNVLRRYMLTMSELEPAYKAYEKIAESYAKTTR